MAYLLDTSILILAIRNADAFGKIDASLDLRNPDLNLTLSIISYGEIDGFSQKRDWGQTKLSLLEEMASRFLILPIDQISIARKYADLEVMNERNGLNIGQNDL